jgi:hypothetical protein
MKLDCPLPSLQELATAPSPDTDKCSPQCPILFSSPQIFVLFSQLRIDVPSALHS